MDDSTPADAAIGSQPAGPVRVDLSELSEVDLLLRLARRWRHVGMEEGAGDGDPGATGPQLAPHQQRALLALVRLSRRDPPHGEGVRVSALADHLGIAPRSATDVADVLEREGLALRSPDPSDRRAVLLTLTDRARSTVEQIRTRRRSAADAAVSALAPNDRAELRRLLTVLLDPASAPDRTSG